MDYQLGDVCRSGYGSPARYVTVDWCVWVSAMSNDLMLTRGVHPPDGRETRLPLPTLTECQRAQTFLETTLPSPQNSFDIGELADDYKPAPPQTYTVTGRIVVFGGEQIIVPIRPERS